MKAIEGFNGPAILLPAVEKTSAMNSLGLPMMTAAVLQTGDNGSALAIGGPILQ